MAVGGLALARGLTLEGLTTSYVLRNVGAADTLLQMGRWFGYRPGYERLCRVHMTENMHAHFTEINESVEELRHDLVVMEKQKKRPSEFGLKVRHSPTGIAITAANKMRTAEEIEVALDLSCKHTQAYEVYDDLAINKHNKMAIDELLASLNVNGSTNYNEEDKAIVYSNVPVQEVLELLTKFQNPTTHFALGSNNESLVTNYISDRLKELSSWDVAIPFVGLKSNRPFPYQTDKNAYCRSRHSGDTGDLEKGKVKITAKNVVADPNPNDLRFGQGDITESVNKLKKEDSDLRPTQAHLQARRKPLLILHIFDFEDKENRSSLSRAEDLVVSLSIGFPETKVKVKPKKYAATSRFLEMLKSMASENETDEVLEDE
ncbi:Z1 domain-containing protein [Salinimonas marina]|uniref:Z1 domain-containing protein n=1 Tax=Salinimonas marina TaxID=2785918 RepID=UPI0022B74FC4|nr:Z1 domain-containing protein [Salinimonas marina]